MTIKILDKLGGPPRGPMVGSSPLDTNHWEIPIREFKVGPLSTHTRDRVFVHQYGDQFGWMISVIFSNDFRRGFQLLEDLAGLDAGIAKKLAEPMNG